MKIKSFYKSGAATGYTPWHFLDWRQNPFAVSFQVDHKGTTLAYTVEYGYSDLIVKQPTITRSTTTATLTYPNHGLNTGDSVIVSGCGAPLDGTFQVTYSSANAVTYTVANSGATVVSPEFARALFVRVMTHDSYSPAVTASSDGNLAFSVQATRVKITVAEASTYLNFHVSQGSN